MPIDNPHLSRVLLQSDTLHEHRLGGWQHAIKQAVDASECRPEFPKGVGGCFRSGIAEWDNNSTKINIREAKTKPTFGFQPAERRFAGIAQTEDDIGIEEDARRPIHIARLHDYPCSSKILSQSHDPAQDTLFFCQGEVRIPPVERMQNGLSADFLELP